MACCRPAEPPPAFPLRDCTAQIVFAPQEPLAAAPSVAGEWSAYSQQAMIPLPGGAYGLALALEPRDYAYDLVADGQTLLDPKNAFTRWVSGVEHSRLRVPDCRWPALELVRFHSTPGGELEVDAQYRDGLAQA